MKADMPKGGGTPDLCIIGGGSAGLAAAAAARRATNQRATFSDRRRLQPKAAQYSRAGRHPPSHQRDAKTPFRSDE